jgi:NADPH:quinone reductase-like Zn-dependent oxidoreductase/SAM-dependent methyltransferase
MPHTERLITHRTEWRPDIAFDSTIASRSRLCALSSEDLEMEQNAFLLNSSAAMYIKQLLEELAHTCVQVPAKHHQLLLHWMRIFVQSETFGMLVSANTDDEGLEHEKASATGVAGEMLCQTGSHLFDIITGKTDALTVMLENNLLYRVYSEDSSARCYSHLIEYIKKLSFKQPYLRILEVGAGTGGLTHGLLQAHSKNHELFFSSYHYTDISSGFFDHAQSTFESWRDQIHFQVLDVEKDPTAQGFEEHAYDLVIASNVIHATRSTGGSISNIHKLLKPGGRLALIEDVHLTAAHMVTFGLLPGWWAGVDDGRVHGPLLSLSQWHDTLLRCGFNGNEVVENDFSGAGHRSSLIISRKVEHTTMESSISIPPPINFINQDMSAGAIDFRDSLFAELEAQGVAPTTIEWPCVDRIENSTYVLLDIDGDHILSNPSEAVFSHLSDLMMRASKVLWITGGRIQNDARAATRGLVTGFARVARAESASLSLSILDIQQDLMVGRSGLIRAISTILQRLQKEPTGRVDDIEYIYRNGCVLIPRLIPDSEINSDIVATERERKMCVLPFHQTDRPLRLDVQKPGLLDSMCFVDDSRAVEPLGPDEVVISTKAHGINFKDVFIALGQMKPGVRMCGECSGTVIAAGENCKQVRVGDRVCAFDATPFASHTKAALTNVHKIPDSMSFVEAASLPVVFATAYYSLVDIARLRPGQSVLIHSAAGGVGQAAITIAQKIGAVIYATVGNDAKRRLLADNYSISEENILSSRTRRFKNEVMRLTNGRGVDVVLNSLAGEYLQASWGCIAAFGTFVEIGKSDIYKKHSLRMDVFDKNVTFASVDLSLMSELQPQSVQRLMSDLFSFLEVGKLRVPQAITTYGIEDIENAFRLIQSGRHTGKVVLTSEIDSVIKTTLPKSPALELRRSGTYVVSGGLGTLARHIARFLAQHGAGGILLLSRRKLEHADKGLISELQAYGSVVEVAQCDITSSESLGTALKIMQDKMPPIRGVIQAAMVLSVHKLHDHIVPHADTII